MRITYFVDIKYIIALGFFIGAALAYCGVSIYEWLRKKVNKL